eukprot:TRINITY_DN241_c0_g1_i20.p2 TRINITY_DN241_c0_g1~~TRINITY_DN241_c0_g1_i20.p2  ORF type:complete len:227 (-),score=28.58 TRINITY_DN241_c0_g1_i20:566-1246(-)
MIYRGTNKIKLHVNSSTQRIFPKFVPKHKNFQIKGQYLFSSSSFLVKQKRKLKMSVTAQKTKSTDVVKHEDQPGKEVEGDLIALALKGDFDIIIHGCNCFNTMGAGIAKQIKKNFPEVYQADKETESGSKDKMGQISYAEVERDGVTFTVVNAYIQYNYKGRGNLVNYDSLRKAFQGVKKLFSGKRIGYPMIGAGLAGGDWRIIQRIVDEELKGEDHTLVRLPPRQ